MLADISGFTAWASLPENPKVRHQPRYPECRRRLLCEFLVGSRQRAQRGSLYSSGDTESIQSDGKSVDEAESSVCCLSYKNMTRLFGWNVDGAVRDHIRSGEYFSYTVDSSKHSLKDCILFRFLIPFPKTRRELRFD